MFENKQPLCFQKFVFENKTGKCINIFQFIGWIGEDKVVGFSNMCNKSESIGTENLQFGYTEQCGIFFYSAVHPEIMLYSMYFLASPRHQLITDASGARKQVERYGFLKVDVIIQNVKKIFFSKIGGRPCFEAFRYRNPPSFIFPAYYPQFITLNKLR